MIDERRKLLKVGLVYATLIAASYWGITTLHDRLDKKKVAKMTEKMMTVCVGRFLIDVPEDTDVYFTTATVSGVQIGVTPNYSDEQLANILNQRKQDLAVRRNEYGRPSLEKNMLVKAVNFDASIFYFARTKPLKMIEYGKPVMGTEEGITVEALGIKEQVFYRLFGADFSSPKNDDNVLHVLQKLKFLQPREIPTEPGFCIDRGLILDPLTAEQNEHVTFYATMKKSPDVEIRLDADINLDKLGESLSIRDANTGLKQSHPFNFTSLRKGTRTINGIDGEEILDRVKEEDGVSSHGFIWESPGKLNDVMAPYISLEFSTGKTPSGKTINSSLTDEAALELFDKISSTLRLRPTSSDKHSQIDTPRSPLGELAMTGRPCPQTGWWRCNEGREVAGGKRQHFIAGEIMPHALLLGTPTLWQKLKGEQPSHESVTVWKLVDYDDVPVVPVSVAAAPTTDTHVASVPAIDKEKNGESPNDG